MATDDTAVQDAAALSKAIELRIERIRRIIDGWTKDVERALSEGREPPLPERVGDLGRKTRD
jgi:hypothetical protein